MKRIIGYVAVCLIASIALYSCQKKSVKPAAPAVTPFDGYWYGAYLNTNTGIIAREGILFRPSGTLRVYDFSGQTNQTDTTRATAIGNGTYTVIDAKSLSVKYTFDQVPGLFTGTASLNTALEQVTITFTGGGTVDTQIAELDKQ